MSRQDEQRQNRDRTQRGDKEMEGDGRDSPWSIFRDEEVPGEKLLRPLGSRGRPFLTQSNNCKARRRPVSSAAP
jgi:hypothetical protein